MTTGNDWFRRLLLPGFAFKAVVIGGGYATGRELVAFFLPSGPWGGLYAMIAATLVWSVVCVLTFLVALRSGSRDYRSFFVYLLGPAWPAFEIALVLAIMVILAVFAAAAGAIGQAVFGLPAWAGSLALSGCIALVTTFGNDAVERLFKYVSFFLYATYALFLVLALTRFGGLITSAFADAPATPPAGWLLGGITYAGYNIVGAAIILPVTRHLRGAKDAIVAGLLAGLLAMAPAILFFVAIAAFGSPIAGQALPSDFLLKRLDVPGFRLVFQAMIFAALIESGTGQVHAINERIANSLARSARTLTAGARLLVTVAILVGSILVADRIGLIALIATGYRWLAYLFLAVYVVPLLTIGTYRVTRTRPAEAARLQGAI